MPRTRAVSSLLGSLPTCLEAKATYDGGKKGEVFLNSLPPPPPISTVITYEPASPEEEMSHSLPDDLKNNGERPLSSDSSGVDEEAHVAKRTYNLNNSKLTQSINDDGWN